MNAQKQHVSSLLSSSFWHNLAPGIHPLLNIIVTLIIRYRRARLCPNYVRPMNTVLVLYFSCVYCSFGVSRCCHYLKNKRGYYTNKSTHLRICVSTTYKSQKTKINTYLYFYLLAKLHLFNCIKWAANLMLY